MFLRKGWTQEGRVDWQKKDQRSVKGEQVSAFLYALPILCSLVTSRDHSWGWQPRFVCSPVAARRALPQKSSVVVSVCVC